MSALGEGLLYAAMAIVPGYTAAYGGVGSYPIFLVAVLVFGADTLRIAQLTPAWKDSQARSTVMLLRSAAAALTVAAVAVIYWAFFVLPVTHPTSGADDLNVAVAGAYWASIAVVACVNGWHWARYARKLSGLPGEDRRAAVSARFAWMIVVSWNAAFGSTFLFLIPMLYMVQTS
ncbi:hypothetical protein [Leifsonia sp. Leaf264]|uniref:hypothetical protein n=1 Tax=Leifsonia sp. Leaf264 TaxID=1736314 RepID=UPI0006FA12D3|nr:hypothetical protein [Leifsonia sp. Leaf264]KQO98788.1 hypothetical protein ASF30_12050 [Leifsonia sp. Leaf264]